MSQNASAQGLEIRRQLERLARAQGLPLDRLIQDFAIERFLYRLSRSPWVDRFVVKGAALLRIWGGPLTRPTRDIDFSGRIDGSPDAVAAAVKECLGTDVMEDGIVFSFDLESEVISVDDRYPGVRIVLRGELAGARIRLQLDVGVGDVVVPEAGWVDYPTLLDLPHPRILAYAPSTSIAEKFHTMVEWGTANSRMKDFYDVWLLTTALEFDGPELVAALEATFARRATAIPVDLPEALTQAFWENPNTVGRWNAFMSRVGGDAAPVLRDAVEIIAAFIGPAAAAAAAREPFDFWWTKGGPWLSSAAKE